VSTEGTAPVEQARPRPRLRGLIHRYASVAFAIGFVVLVAVGAPAERPWLAAYGLAVTTMLAVSAAYHSGRLSPSAQVVFKRIDHSTILLAIAGSYTGIVGLGLEGPSRTRMLVLVWILAVIGMAIRMLWLHAPYPIVAAVYLAVGWVALTDVDALTGALTGSELALVVLGGVLYSVGAAVYALHAPNPWPATFGYHEVFHLLVVLAAAVHLAAVASLVASG
jgi:hemolysin III